MTLREDGANLITPTERVRAIAHILATGILRLRARAALPPVSAPQILSESAPNSLEVSCETVLNVHSG
jgi:hypothetical protein